MIDGKKILNSIKEKIIANNGKVLHTYSEDGKTNYFFAASLRSLEYIPCPRLAAASASAVFEIPC